MAVKIWRGSLYAPLILYFLSAFSASAQPSSAADDVWMPVGPQAGTVFALESDPFNEETFYAGTYFGGLYRSVDRGQNWVHMPSPFSTYSVFSLVVDSQVRGRIFAGTFQSGVYVSDDGGRSWRASNTGLRNLNIQQLTANPADSNQLLVTTNSGVYNSTDGGRSWNVPERAEGIQFGKCAIFDPKNTSTVYLGTTGLGVFRSPDGGRNWTEFSNGLRNPVVVDFKFSPRTGALYAAVSNGVYRLSAGETNWVNLSENLPTDVSVAGLSINTSAGADEGLYLSTDKGVYSRREGDREPGWSVWATQPSRLLLFRSGFAMLSRFGGGLRASADGGRSWVNRENGMQNLFVGALTTMQRFGESQVLAGSDSGVFRLEESGGWKKAPNFTEGIFRYLVDPTNPSTVFAGTERAGVWKSTDAGLTWESSADGIVPPGFFGVSLAAERGVIYAATTSGLYISRNGGEKWGQDQVTGTLGTAFSVEADPVEKNRVVFGSDGGKVFESFDLGKTFTLINRGLPPELIRSIRIIPFGATYAVTSGGSLYILNPADHVWQPVWIDPVKGALAVDADPKTPWVLYLATQDGMYKSESGGIEWKKSNDGIESPPQVYTVVVDRVTDGLIYAGGTGTVYRSTDAGTTWKPFREGLPANGAVVSISIDPLKPTLLYVSVQDNGVFRSTDGGVSWSRFGNTLPEQGVTTVALDPAGTGTIYAGTYLEGLFVSRGGREFVRDAPGLTLFVRGLAADRGGRRVFAGALLGGIFRSDDAGVTWHNRGLLDRNLFDVQVDPSSGTVYVGSGIGLSRSVDGGDTWSDIIPRVAYVTAQAVDPRNRNIVYTGSLAGRLNRSADGGTTWKEAGRGLPYLTILSLSVDGRDGAVYASLEGGGIYRSTNGGLDWQKASDFLLGSNFSAQVIKVSPQTSVIYAASRGAGIFLSPDQGGFWVSINGNLGSYEVTDLAFDAENRLYVSTLNAGIFRTADNGKTWETVSEGLPQQPAVALASTPSDGGRIYAATGSGIYWISGSGNWQKLANSLEGGILTSVAVSDDGAAILVSMEGVGLLRTLDHGENWTTVNADVKGTGVRYLDLGPTNLDILAGTQGLGLIRSRDGGGTWQGAIQPQLVEPAVLAVRLDSQNPQRLYAGTAGAGFLVSTNGGADWKASNAGLESKQILSLAVDPERGGVVYAGTVGGLFLTEDGGENWRSLGKGLFNQTVTALTVDTKNPAVVYAGTEGGGVFRLKRGTR